MLIEPGTLFIKVCGLTSAEDAAMCAAAGVDAIGINFHPASKRYHPLEAAKQWLGAVPAGLKRVALFVNAPLPAVAEAVATGLFDAVQLHGDEGREFTVAVQQLGLPVIRAVALHDEAGLEALASEPADAILLDAPAPGLYGGTGRVCDWELAARAVQACGNRPVLLAGGLTPANAAAAVRAVRPAGLDTASGVESAPGRKDAEAVRAFVAAARAAIPDFSDRE